MPDSPRPPRALILGSIGTLAETSDLQRRAFNAAFRDAGLPLVWSTETYRDLLARPGGRDRIGAEAARLGLEVDVEALHARKTAHFLALLRRTAPPLRAGVVRTLAAARAAGLRLALATTTGRDVVDAVLAHAGPPSLADAFDLVLSRADDLPPKPDPAVYHHALARLGLTPAEAIAVEDSPESAAAARAARLPILAFPGAFHRGRDFGAPATDRLSPALLGLTDAAADAPLDATC